MVWSGSKPFRAAQTDMWSKTAAFDLDADTINAAAFGNTITPDSDVSAANSAYGAGVWATGGLSDGTAWPAIGRPLQNKAITNPSANVIKFTADPVVSNGACSLAGITGVLHYDDTLTTPVADQGVCFNYLGGAQTIVSGILTLTPHASGIMVATIS